MTDQPKSTFAKYVRAARPRTKRYDIHGDAIPGLSLRVFPSGARSFALERTVRGRRRYARIGSADEVTTFVTSTTMTAASIEAGRLAHRLARQQFELHAPERRKALADEAGEVLGLWLALDGLAQDQPHFLFHGTAVARRGRPSTRNVTTPNCGAGTCATTFRGPGKAGRT